MTRIWPIAIGIFLIMLPVTGVVPLLYELTEGRYPGRSDLQRHLFMSANLGGALLFALLAGLWSDRLGRRKALIVPALVVFGGALLLMMMPWPYAVQLLLRFIEGGAHMTVLVLAMTMAADVAGPERRGRALGLVGATMSLGVASGSALGGQIGSEEATRIFLWGGSLMLALAALATLVLKDVVLQPAASRLKEILQLVLQRRALLVPYTFTFVDRLTVGFIISTVSLYFATVLGLTPIQIGLAMAAFLLPYGILTFPAGLLSERINPMWLMSIGSVLYGSYLMVLGVASSDQIIGVMVGGGVVASLMLAPSLILTSRFAGNSEQATAMGGFHLIGSLGFMLGPMLGVGVVTGIQAAGWPPYPGAFIVIGSLELLCVAIFLPWMWRLARQNKYCAEA